MHRAQEKKDLLQAWQQQAQQVPSQWQPGSKNPQQYQAIQVSGYYLPQTLLWDNQYYQHQSGYHVINALQLANDKVVLVDRGWVAAGDRSQLPGIDIPTGLIQLSGTSDYPQTNHWLLGAAIDRKSGDMVVIESLDMQVIRQILHKSVYPFIIRLKQNADHGYVRHWVITTMSPARHYGYALQWFAMACAVLVIYIALNIKKNE